MERVGTKAEVERWPGSWSEVERERPRPDRKPAPPAGFLVRSLAFLIDLAILYALGFGLWHVVMAILRSGFELGPPTLATIGRVTQGVALLLAIAYFAGLESSGAGATLGKRLLGLRVTDLEGGRIGFGRALGRLLSKFLSFALLLTGFVMAAFTERKRALHDRIAGTIVVKSGPRR